MMINTLKCYEIPSLSLYAINIALGQWCTDGDYDKIITEGISALIIGVKFLLFLQKDFLN